jgi:TolA-binding protein
MEGKVQQQAQQQQQQQEEQQQQQQQQQEEVDSGTGQCWTCWGTPPPACRWRATAPASQPGSTRPAAGRAAAAGRPTAAAAAVSACS